jgi:hypothetical protein
MTYSNTVTFEHYPTISSKEIELEFISSVTETNNGTLSFGDTNTTQLVYSGAPILKRYYGIQLVGVPSDTILNPIQQRYIGSVTTDFLETYSKQKPYLVDVIGQVLTVERRRLGASKDDYHRQLQLGVVTLKSVVYGIGTSEDDFFEAIQKAISSENQKLKSHLQLDHNRPGPINEDKTDSDLGDIFNNLVRVSFTANVTRASSGTLGGTENSNTILVTLFSVLIVLSFFFLTYSIRRDYFQPLKRGDTLTGRRGREEQEEEVPLKKTPTNNKKESPKRKNINQTKKSATKNQPRKKKVASSSPPRQPQKHLSKQKKSPSGTTSSDGHAQRKKRVQRPDNRPKARKKTPTKRKPPPFK